MEKALRKKLPFTYNASHKLFKVKMRPTACVRQQKPAMGCPSVHTECLVCPHPWAGLQRDRQRQRNSKRKSKRGAEERRTERHKERKRKLKNKGTRQLSQEAVKFYYTRTEKLSNFKTRKPDTHKLKEETVYFSHDLRHFSPVNWIQGTSSSEGLFQVGVPGTVLQ